MTTTDTREERRAEVRRRVLDAAWRLAERDGLTAWTLRDLAAEVGMRAPSLYTHFDGKDAIHDAMFAEGWRALDAALDVALDADVAVHDEPLARLVVATGAFVDFCTESVPRYQLMFTHVLGAWEPSADAYAASRAVYARMTEQLGAIGVTDPAHLDLYTAMASGLVAQQLANDREGDRWRRLVPDAASMFLAHVDTTRTGSTP